MGKGGQFPTYETMCSTYTKKREPNYFKMVEGEVATVHTTIARTIVSLVVFKIDLLSSQTRSQTARMEIGCRTANAIGQFSRDLEFRQLRTSG